MAKLGTMLTFGHVYLNQRFVTYDVAHELVDGRLVYVASLSQDPRVRAVAARQDLAVALLMAKLGRLVGQLVETQVGKFGDPGGLAW